MFCRWNGLDQYKRLPLVPNKKWNTQPIHHGYVMAIAMQFVSITLSLLFSASFWRNKSFFFFLCTHVSAFIRSVDRMFLLMARISVYINMNRNHMSLVHITVSTENLLCYKTYPLLWNIIAVLESCKIYKITCK
jgi:hypothetical protein